MELMDNTTAAWLATEWAAAIRAVLAKMTGEEVRSEVGGPALPAFATGDIVWEHAFDSDQAARLAIRISQSGWQSLGELVLISAGIDEVEPSEARTAFLEIAAQSVAELKAPLVSRFKSEISWLPGKESDVPLEGHAFSAQLELKPGATLSLEFVISPELVDCLENGASSSASPETGVSEKIAPARNAPGKEVNLPRALDLLLDVELPVSVSFGRAQIRLKEVLKLTTGSIVELHRTVTEPVEVIVNNCVIARGEVVVEEGNYGVRIPDRRPSATIARPCAPPSSGKSRD
jgi:flagellar motor switch protein FliN/FliY